MNKDAILATVIGFVVGLIITGLLLIGPKLSGFLPKISWPQFSVAKQDQPKTQQEAKKETGFTIDSPLPDTIEDASSLLVSGTATPGATLVIQTDVDDEVVLAKEDGKYAGKITLVEGKNDITVTSYHKEASDVRTVTVFYTEENF